MTEGEQARRRAAATKRQRTENRLLATVSAMFDERGWHGTRFEDIAKGAGVGLATAYNHFPTKHRLAERAYAPLLDTLTTIVRPSEPLASMAQYVTKLADIAERHRALATAMVLAANSGESEAFTQVVTALARILEDGQSRGLLSSRNKASDVASYHVYALLSFAAMQLHESQQLARLVLSQMLPALRTDGPSPSPAP